MSSVHAVGRYTVALPGRCVWRWDWEDVSLFCDSAPLLGGVECWEHLILRVQASPDPDAPIADCGCWTCDDTRRAERAASGDWLAALGRYMILCPECGNKRCPKATHHDNVCTGSNAPGQPGSGYPLLPPLEPGLAATVADLDLSS